MKNKTLSILFIFIIFSFILTNSCFAFNQKFEFNNEENSFSIGDILFNKLISLEEYNNSNYYFIITERAKTGYVWFINKDIDLKVWLGDISGTLGSNIAELYNYTAISYVIDPTGEIVSTNYSATDFAYKYYQDGNRHCFYTNLDIYSDVTCSNVFYRYINPDDTFLSNSLKNINPLNIYKNLMSNVVYILLILIVGILAFRKGWSFLKGEIKKA